MGLSVSMIAKEHEDFIRNGLERAEKSLHPSVTDDEELVRRSLFAVRNKSVVFNRFISVYGILDTTVQDVRPTNVTVDFRKEQIICSCPQQGWCRHKVSVLLSLYQHFDSVQDWATNWRVNKNVNLHSLAKERSPESWLAMVDEIMSHLLRDGQPLEGVFISSIVENAHDKLNKLKPFEREWQPIFHLFMELAVLNRLWDYLIETNSPIQSKYFEYFFDRRFDLLQNNLDLIKGKSRLFETDPFFDTIQQLVRDLLINGRELEDRRLNLYTTFWNSIFTEKSRAKKEIAILQEYLSTGNYDDNVPLHHVCNLFFILLKEHDELKQNIEKISVNDVMIYLGLARFAFEQQDQYAGELILRATLPFINEFINVLILPAYRQMYVKRVDALYEKIDLNEQEQLQLFSSFGIYGIQPYSSYLLKNKKYNQWVALHQLYPSSISYLDSCGLKEILKEAPEVTLPLYHYYAIQEVNQKTRANYKQAVRIWKQMKSAAKKSGKLNYWTDYIQTVRNQFKRLRALQEELEKGNLLV